MNLDELLEATIAMVRSAVKDVPANQDLRPLFIYFRPSGEVVVVDVAAGMETPATKNFLAATCRARLRDEQATAYALITAGWLVKRKNPTPEAADELRRVFQREGSEGRYRDERREVYWVQCSDRERTATAALYVRRDYKGKIRELVDDPDTRAAGITTPDRLEGRMTNWLREAP